MSSFLVLATMLAALDWSLRTNQHRVCVTVIGGGGTALRDFVSDAVGNATQDANYKGLYLPFYTVGTGVGEIFTLAQMILGRVLMCDSLTWHTPSPSRLGRLPRIKALSWPFSEHER